MAESAEHAEVAGDPDRQARPRPLPQRFRPQMITLRQLTLARGGKVLLEGIDLTLHAGQKIGVVGPNGSGKSSLFALLLGDLHKIGRAHV